MEVAALVICLVALVFIVVEVVEGLEARYVDSKGSVARARRDIVGRQHFGAATLWGQQHCGDSLNVLVVSVPTLAILILGRPSISSPNTIYETITCYLY
jgi:hypothetical protein